MRKDKIRVFHLATALFLLACAMSSADMLALEYDVKPQGYGDVAAFLWPCFPVEAWTEYAPLPGEATLPSGLPGPVYMSFTIEGAAGTPDWQMPDTGSWSLFCLNMSDASTLALESGTFTITDCDVLDDYWYDLYGYASYYRRRALTLDLVADPGVANPAHSIDMSMLDLECTLTEVLDLPGINVHHHIWYHVNGSVRGYIVPEPASICLLGIGLAGVAAERLRRRRRS